MIQNALYLSLGLHERLPSYRRSITPFNENIQLFKTGIFSLFFGRSILPSGSKPLQKNFLRLKPSHSWILNIYVFRCRVYSRRCGWGPSLATSTFTRRWRSGSDASTPFGSRTPSSPLCKFFPGLRIRIHLIRIRIQHFRLNTDPYQDPIRIQGFDDQKLRKKNSSWNFFFFQNLQFTSP